MKQLAEIKDALVCYDIVVSVCVCVCARARTHVHVRVCAFFMLVCVGTPF